MNFEILLLAAGSMPELIQSFMDQYRPKHGEGWRLKNFQVLNEFVIEQGSLLGSAGQPVTRPLYTMVAHIEKELPNSILEMV